MPTLTPRPRASGSGELEPSAARWEGKLGEYVLDWEDVLAATDPHGFALQFARSAYSHACSICDWDRTLAGSGEGVPPPVS